MVNDEAEVRSKAVSCETLFRSLDDASRPRNAGFISLIVANLKQAFENLRMASYDTLYGIATYRWGREAIGGHGGCVTFLLDRNVDPSYHGKQKKYNIVRRLAEAPDAEQTIERRNLDRLRRYVQEGAFYKETEAAVALESAT
ncbi:proteasome non-ATPase 26S subunit-domain-containing protein [Thamnocephalis sphaerospora]|uniref:Proteasome non-ATPase 26S subunit-domain-containing protein n=1 Tax=Thamnocephalis sphaerospora TaxID=78915 RepID=A0A4P9XM53_9FUNG|nr:proteasome non-ATPase 26S subunit-domain-containing protein [Thamnocephalis sphaerospora]|eukprot:RKP06945.1 proteasome non-ATPase 26S subunit-domain-containing protein [Thamnocephalis sphaerospora]